MVPVPAPPLTIHFGKVTQSILWLAGKSPWPNVSHKQTECCCVCQKMKTKQKVPQTRDCSTRGQPNCLSNNSAHTVYFWALCIVQPPKSWATKKKWTNRPQEQSWSFLNLKERNVLGAHMSFHYKTDYLLLHQTPQQSWIMTFESSNPFPHPHPCTCRDKEILWVIKAGAKCTTGNSWCRTWSHFPWREQLRTG